MSNLLSFGQYKGRTFEWLFFHAPGYAEGMYDDDIHRQRHLFTVAEEEHFDELVRRASALRGMCRWCRAQRITRLGITSFLAGGPDHIGFYCGRCEYGEHSRPFYGAASFFVEYENVPERTQRRVTRYIQHRYIGKGRLTQAKMEDFFQNDDLFVYATPGFFAKVPLTVASG